MDEGVSGYLDVIRVVAALEVFLAHLGDKFGGEEAKVFVPYAHQAVIAFFVLSGYVIAYVSSERETDIISFAISRASRIYSVSILALILTAGIDCFLISNKLHVSAHYQLAQPWKYGPLFLVFGTDWWFLNEDAFSDAPYWSLCYEVWYYVLFAVWFYLVGRTRFCLCCVVLLFVGPRSWLLLPIWLSGVWLYRQRSRGPWPVTIARTIWAATVVGLMIFLLTGWYDMPTDAVYRAIGDRFRHLLRYSQYFLSDYIICAMIVLNIAAASHCRFRFGKSARSIRYLAGLTFVLYLMHYPLLQLYSRWLRSWQLMIAVVGSVWLLGMLSERLRVMMRCLLLACFAPRRVAESARHGV